MLNFIKEKLTIHTSYPKESSDLQKALRDLSRERRRSARFREALRECRFQSNKDQETIRDQQREIRLLRTLNLIRDLQSSRAGMFLLSIYAIPLIGKLLENKLVTIYDEAQKIRTDKTQVQV